MSLNNPAGAYGLWSLFALYDKKLVYHLYFAGDRLFLSLLSSLFFVFLLCNRAYTSLSAAFLQKKTAQKIVQVGGPWTLAKAKM